MKIQVKVTPKVLIEAEGNTHTELFAQIAELQEIFGQGKCGKCECEDLRFVVREVDGNSFYELRCQNPKCRAVLSFGQNKDGAKKGNLFPHIKENKKGTIMGLEPGTYLPNGGWLRYDAKTQKKE